MVDPVQEGLYQIKLLDACRKLTGEKPRSKALGDFKLPTEPKQTKKEENRKTNG